MILPVSRSLILGLYEEGAVFLLADCRVVDHCRHEECNCDVEQSACCHCAVERAERNDNAEGDADVAEPPGALVGTGHIRLRLCELYPGDEAAQSHECRAHVCDDDDNVNRADEGQDNADNGGDEKGVDRRAVLVELAEEAGQALAACQRVGLTGLADDDAVKGCDKANHCDDDEYDAHRAAFAEEVIDDVCDRCIVLKKLLLGQEREGGHEHEHTADEQGEDTDDEALGDILGGVLALLRAHAACLKREVEPYRIGDRNEDALYAAEIAHLSEQAEICVGQADACVEYNARNADDGDDKADELTCFDAAHIDKEEYQVCDDGCNNCGYDREQGVNICTDGDTDTWGAEQGFNEVAEACEEACAAAEGLFGVGCGACGAGDSGCELCKHECEGDVEQGCYSHCYETARKVGFGRDVVPAVVAAGNNSADRDRPYACGSQGFFKFLFFHEYSTSL
jgi:hypothetical protein